MAQQNKKRGVRKSRAWWIFFHLFTGLVLVIGGSACGTTATKFTDPIIGPDFKPVNVYVKGTNLPSNVRRLVILPITTETAATWSLNGAQNVEPGFKAELGKIGRFELVSPSRAQVRQWTGQETWRVDEQFPAAFFDTLREKTGCDAVLFVHLSSYQPYPPLLIGWRTKLVAVAGRETLWSADETFDSSEQTVSNGARRYAQGHVPQNPVLEDSRSILLVPARFAQYTAATLVKTIPPR